MAASCQNQDGTPARIRPISTQRTSAQVTAVAYPDICLWIHNIAPQTNSHKAKTSVLSSKLYEKSKYFTYAACTGQQACRWYAKRLYVCFYLFQSHNFLALSYEA